MENLVFFLGGLVSGICFGYQSYLSKSRNIWRRRGYVLIFVDNFGWKWKWSGYGKSLEPMELSKAFPTFADALANAEAHYHASILNKTLE